MKAETVGGRFRGQLVVGALLLCLTSWVVDSIKAAGARPAFAMATARQAERDGHGGVPFDFKTETFSFQNAMVWEYKNGVRVGNSRSKDNYTRRCFVMSRAAMQFHKFARFDPHGAPLDDKELARRIRIVAHREPWQSPLPADQRTVFPGYRNVREMSEKREAVLK